MALLANCCTYKFARRCLLIMNVLNFIFALAFIGVGAVSVQKGQTLHQEFNDLCKDQCGKIGCTTSDCKNVARPDKKFESLLQADSGCDCSRSGGESTISFGAFVAPGGGFIAVGVFSICCAIFGLAGAVRATAPCLLGYIIVLSLIIILQFSFGIAAAAIERPKEIDLFRKILSRDLTSINWQDFGPILPYACLASSYKMPAKTNPTTTTRSYTVYYPACTFDNMCMPNNTDFERTDWIPKGTPPDSCCQTGCSTSSKASGTCGCISSDKCMSGLDCVYAGMTNIGGPVAGLALVTLIFEVASLCWACVVWRKAKSGDTGEGQSGGTEMGPGPSGGANI